VRPLGRRVLPPGRRPKRLCDRRPDARQGAAPCPAGISYAVCCAVSQLTPYVNIMGRPEQIALLRPAVAQWRCDSGAHRMRSPAPSPPLLLLPAPQLPRRVQLDPPQVEALTSVKTQLPYEYYVLPFCHKGVDLKQQDGNPPFPPPRLAPPSRPRSLGRMALTRCPCGPQRSTSARSCTARASTRHPTPSRSAKCAAHPTPLWRPYPARPPRGCRALTEGRVGRVVPDPVPLGVRPAGGAGWGPLAPYPCSRFCRRHIFSSRQLSVSVRHFCTGGCCP
jgi:hypothetical protein